MNAKRGQELTPKKAKNLVRVAKILIPTAAPYAMRAAAAARDQYDRVRAHRIGIAVDDLGTFTGKGAALHARIANLREPLDELPTRVVYTNDDGAAAQRFVEYAHNRLTQLATAARAAERMPAGRRRAAHRAIRAELDKIEDTLMGHLHLER